MQDASYFIRFTTGKRAPLIFFPVTINRSKTYHFILDTGSAVTLLSPQLKEAIALNHTGIRDTFGAAGMLQVATSVIPVLSIGGYSIANLEAGVSESVREIATLAGSPADGIAGYGCFKNTILSIDYPGRNIHISNTPPQSKNKMRISPSASLEHLVILEVYLNNSGPFNFVLDSGASVTSIDRDLISELNLPTAGDTAFSAIKGKGAATTTIVKKMSIGNLKIENIETLGVDYLQELGNAAGKKIDGVIGFNFLKDYHLTIDYINGYVHVCK